jgi:hypothetical protein
MMQATAWSNGGGTYGIRVGFSNRQKFFDRGWTGIEIEIDGEVHQFATQGGFWRQCPEIRDTGEPVIREWLRQHRTLKWRKGDPPRMELVPLGENRFRLDR